MKKEIALVCMVAGLSSRFEGKIKQLTKVGPNNEPLLEVLFNQALPAGFSKIILVVSDRTGQSFRELFGYSYNGIPISYARQNFNPEKRDKPWGTVDALCSAKDLINCPFVVCNGDDLYGKESFKTLVNHLREKETSATIGYPLLSVLPESGTTNRGVFKTENGFVKEIKETFGISRENFREMGFSGEALCNMNFFALHPKDLDYLYEELIKFKEENKGDRKIECLLPEEISDLIKEGKIEMEIFPTKSQWLGITNPGDEEEVRKSLSKTL